MVQYYPLLFVLMGLTFRFLWRKRLLRLPIFLMVLACVWINLWFTYQAHLGRLYDSDGGMTHEYYWRVLGRLSAPMQTLALRDGKYLFEHDLPPDAQTIYTERLFGDRAGDTCLRIEGKDYHSQAIIQPVIRPKTAWLRASATFRCNLKEWTIWKMPQFILGLKRDGRLVSTTMVRPHRFLDDGESRTIYVDLKLPGAPNPSDSFFVQFWNPASDQTICVSNLSITAF